MLFGFDLMGLLNAWSSKHVCRLFLSTLNRKATIRQPHGNTRRWIYRISQSLIYTRLKRKVLETKLQPTKLLRTNQVLMRFHWLLAFISCLAIEFIKGGKFLKKLGCCVGGRVQGNLILSTESIA